MDTLRDLHPPHPTLTPKASWELLSLHEQKVWRILIGGPFMQNPLNDFNEPAGAQGCIK